MTRLGWRLLGRRLERSLSPDRVAPILGDLEADYRQRRQNRGAWRARAWLAGEALSLVAAYRRQSPARRSFMDRWRSDVVQAWRALRARPAAALAMVGVLALGIGLLSSMFAMADPYVTKPLPFRDAHRLVTLLVRPALAADPVALDDWRARTDLFADVAAYGNTETVIVAAASGAVPLRLLEVTPDYLAVLGTAGPSLVDWRVRPGEAPVVLTAAASQLLGSFGQAGTALAAVDDAGARLGRSYRVDGVLPPAFLFPAGSQSWDGLIPVAGDLMVVGIQRTPAGLAMARPWVQVLARLAPGVEPGQVEAGLSTAPGRERNVLPAEGIVVLASSVVDAMTGRQRPLATGALAAGVLILLVAAANVVNLLLAQGAFRRRELAARRALGATRWDVARLVLLELGVVTGVGVAAGLFVAGGVLWMSSVMIPTQYNVLGSPQISERVVWLALAAGGVVMVAGLLPAVAASRVGAASLVGRSALEAGGLRAARFTMTAVQTAIAVVMLVGAMLLARSHVNLLLRDPGYSSDLFVAGVRYDQRTGVRTVAADVAETIERLRRLEGVTGVGATMGTLVENIGGGFAGPAIVVDGQRVRGRIRFAGHGFFDVAGTRLLAGRFVQPSDGREAAVVTESFAAACCPDRPAVGRRVEWEERGTTRTVGIVGVVADVLDSALDQTPTPAVFVPVDQFTAGSWVTYVLRTPKPTWALASAVEREVQAVSRQASVPNGSLMRDRLMRSIRDRSFATMIVVLFAAAAVGVSAAGLVGVVGATVARRTREIAIRMAVGAQAGDVRRLVTREVVAATSLGAAVGLMAGGWVSTTMESLLFGVSPADPIALALATVLLMAAVVAAAWVPARRATRLSPTVALRVE